MKGIVIWRCSIVVLVIGVDSSSCDVRLSMGSLLTWGGDGWAQKTRLYLHIVPQAFISIKY